MKKVFRLIIAALLMICCLAFVACDKGDSTVTPPAATIVENDSTVKPVEKPQTASSEFYLTLDGVKYDVPQKDAGYVLLLPLKSNVFNVNLPTNESFSVKIEIYTATPANDFLFTLNGVQQPYGFFDDGDYTNDFEIDVNDDAFTLNGAYSLPGVLSHHYGKKATIDWEMVQLPTSPNFLMTVTCSNKQSIKFKFYNVSGVQALELSQDILEFGK